MKDTTKKVTQKPKSNNIFVVIGRYFRDSWLELRQVRWPNRKSTWSMIVAVLVFSGIFIIVITLLDIAFEKLFNLIVR